MNRRKKRGLAPIIATGLLVLLVLVLIAIVIIWARTWFNEELMKFGSPVRNACSQVSFDATYSHSFTGIILELRNTGNIPIHYFEMKTVYQGKAETKQYPSLKLDKTESRREEIALNYNPEKVILYPAIVGTVKGSRLNKAYTCLNNGEEISLNS